MKRLKGHWTTVILILVFLIGLSLLLYPTVSDYWNSLHQSRAIASYAEQVAALDNDTYEVLLAEAQAYNQTLLGKSGRFTLTDEEQEEYESLLNVSGTSVIGYIEIAKINCYLPIYHGTDEAVLQVGVGHLEGSSLPVGGESTHCVISGHRGLPSAKLFTDLDQMEVGDTFILYVLDETLTYEVDQIRIVEPQEVSELEIVQGEDYCTLVTCTPYGINTHRLLVRGHRIENAATSSTVRVTADAMQIEPVVVAPLVAVPILLLLLIGLLIGTRKKSDRRNPDMKLKKRIFALLFVLVLLFTLSLTAYAHDVPDLYQTGSISVTMTYDGAAVFGGTLMLYQVGEIAEDDGNYSFALADDFAESGASLNDISSSDLAQALADYAADNGLTGTTLEITSDGTAVFSDLNLGLYLVVQTEAADGYEAVAPFLVSVPMNEAGTYVYAVDASPKVEVQTATPTPKATVTPTTTPKTTSKTTLPSTGQLNWPIPVMAVLGMLLFSIGWVLRFGK